MTIRRTPATWWRGFAFVLTVALVAVQLLGLGHRIVHADRAQLVLAGTAATTLAADDAPAMKSPAQRPGSWLLALFAGHDPGHDCDAFDQTTSADVNVGIALDAAAPPPASAEACFMHAAWHLAAQAQGFLARAPPFAASLG